jgi:hypothetical protein
MSQADDYDPIADAFRQLHRAGWSIGDVGLHDRAGGLLWIVTGSNGEVRVHDPGPRLLSGTVHT